MAIERITPAELARIRKRHADLPQDELLSVDAATAAKPPKPAQVAAVKWVKCPRHHAGRRTGLVPGPDDTLVFREHHKWIGKHRVICPGSGQVWTDPTKGTTNA